MHIHKTLQLHHFKDTSDFTEKELQLIESAREATYQAFAPYSKFYVGAALLLSDGSLITGSNQENASFPNGLCAERVALNTFGNAQNDRQIVALAVTARSLHYKIPRILCPCGGCLQVMAEYVRSCLNIVLLVLYTPKAAICTNDKVIATQQRHYKKPVLVSE